MLPPREVSVMLSYETYLWFFFKKLFSTCCSKIWKIIFYYYHCVFMSQVSYSKLIFQGNGVMGYNIITIIIVWNLLFENEEVSTSFFCFYTIIVPSSLCVLSLLEPISHNMINSLKRNTITKQSSHARLYFIVIMQTLFYKVLV